MGYIIDFLINWGYWGMLVSAFLSGKKRILKALSNYIKGEIDVGLFANAYHKILCEEYAKSQNPWNITSEGLAAAGIGSE